MLKNIGVINMGIFTDLRNLRKINKELIALENKDKLFGNDEKGIFDYGKVLEKIDKIGFVKMGISFNDLWFLNGKYDLRLSEKQLINVMNSEKPFTSFISLPISRDILYNHLYKDLYELCEGEKYDFKGFNVSLKKW